MFDTLVEIGGHRKRFIVKKYFDYPTDAIEKRTKASPLGWSKINAQTAFKNYSLAQKAGLKVFPTFRMGEDKKSILMTTGFLDNQICVSSNNKITVVELGRPLIKEMGGEMLDKFLSTIFTEGLKASQKQISLHSDMFFFILSKDEPTKIDFVLGDLDNLRKEEKLIPTESIKSDNMINIKKALYHFCEKNINRNFSKKFLDKIEYYYTQNVYRDFK
ncbi:hypothetical protein KKG24_00050 [Patescibacteria group bacterium]|nr:hypothetical protein [Patescibacteria group bacterium]